MDLHCARPVYPLRMSAANPKPFDFYLGLRDPAGTGTGMDAPDSLPDSDSYVPFSYYAGYPWQFLSREYDQPKMYPTLAKLSKADMEIFQGATTQGISQVRPEECTRDLEWSIAREYIVPAGVSGSNLLFP